MKTGEDLALPKMEEILRTHGLEITLKVLIDSLQKLINERGSTIFSALMLEVLKGCIQVIYLDLI